MNVLHIDFETRSTVDLKAVGLDNYAKHPTTDVWCLGWAFNDEPVDLIPFAGNDIAACAGGACFLSPLYRHIESSGIVKAHNAAFELAIWNNILVPRYGWPELKPEQVRCTMAMAYAMGLPGALDNAAAAVGLKNQKDQAGHRLMLQMAKPRSVSPTGEITWWDDAERLQRLYAYCKQDVEVERELDKRLMPLSAAEQRLWVLDYKINQRGIQVDLPAIRAALKVVDAEAERLHGEIRRITGNFVGFTSEVARLTEWVRSQGVDIPGLAKADVLDALALEDLPELVRAALLIRQQAGKSSTAKLTAMVNRVSADGRLRGMFQYHGAHTGRWAGRGVQLQNLPRPRPFMKPANLEDAIAHFDDTRYVDMFYGNPLTVISECLRGMLVAAPGHDLIAIDFANIEGRVLAWLAGEEWKLQAFRDYDARVGPDLYLVMAAVLSNVLVSTLSKHSPERQPGKACELAFGFGGAVGAWRKIEKSVGDMPAFSDGQIDTFKDIWRGKHPAIVDFWEALDDAAVTAVLNPGVIYSAGAPGRECKFKKDGSFLWCLLPSKRTLCYPYPQIRPVETPWGKMRDALTYMTELDSTSRKTAKIVELGSGNWHRVSTYGGSLSENVTQAVARDLLSQAMFRFEDAGFPVKLHVHDENVTEIPETAPPDTLKRVEQIMSEVPPWAAGLPIAVEGWRAKRYRK